MNGTKGASMQPDLDLFVVGRRIAADHDRAHAERLARQVRAGSARGGPRVWLGRRISDIGNRLAGEGPRLERPQTADPRC